MRTTAREGFAELWRYPATDCLSITSRTVPTLVLAFFFAEDRYPGGEGAGRDRGTRSGESAVRYSSVDIAQVRQNPLATKSLADAPTRREFRRGVLHAVPGGVVRGLRPAPGHPGATIQLGGIGRLWNPAPYPDSLPVFTGSDSQGLFAQDWPLRLPPAQRCPGRGSTSW